MNSFIVLCGFQNDHYQVLKICFMFLAIKLKHKTEIKVLINNIEDFEIIKISEKSTNHTYSFIV